MNPPMSYSKAGRTLTERFEGCRLESYLDIGGVWTIGYGHTKGVHAGMTCTQAQADLWLIQDTQDAVYDVNKLVTINLNQNEFDALCDFVFNLGAGSFEHSTLLADLNAGHIDAAENQFELWDHDSGKVVAGLLRRRMAEKTEFETT